METDDSSSQLPLAVAAVSVLCIVTGLVSYRLMTPSKSRANNKTVKTSSSASSSSSTSRVPAASSRVSASSPKTSSGSSNRNDVWEERRQKGIAPAKTSTAKTSGTAGDKPFGSSYYYAHNNSGSKGGYSDGLRMEDFTMNGPRLLSKGGKTVDCDENDNDDDNDDDMALEDKNDSSSRDVSASSTTNTIKRKTLAISKYLWDDPGDRKGVATLRIDTLPGRRSAETVEWKDAAVSEATAELFGETELLVKVKAADEQEYRLHIKELYGKATSVQAIVKPKRLLVRLQKKKGYMQLSNVAVWPHPQQKVGQ